MASHSDISCEMDILLLNIDKPISLCIETLSEDSSIHPESITTENNLVSTAFQSVLLPIPQFRLLSSESEPADFDENRWGKSLICLPSVTIKEIEEHRLSSGKTPDSAVIKTLDRGRKFKTERYLSSDSVFTKWDQFYFYIKCQCKPSMKKEKRDVSVTLHLTTGKVATGKCSCTAVESGYCNHVMALLLEVADYSLNQLSSVPEEIACTSRLRQWGIPGEANMNKAPVMDTVIQRQTVSKGISSTLFDPRRKDSRLVSPENLQSKLRNKNKNIGFVCSFPPVDSEKKKINTKYGQFIFGSPLSFHLNPVCTHT